jgi:valyl-tRNA synthetase
MMKPFIEKLAKVEELTFVGSKLENSVTDVSDNLESFISTDDVDMSAIIAKLSNRQALADATDKMAKVEGELEGCLL